jgi:hypothetical protein
VRQQNALNVAASSANSIRSIGATGARGTNLMSHTGAQKFVRRTGARYVSEGACLLLFGKSEL